MFVATLSCSTGLSMDFVCPQARVLVELWPGGSKGGHASLFGEARAAFYKQLEAKICVCVESQRGKVLVHVVMVKYTKIYIDSYRIIR